MSERVAPRLECAYCGGLIGMSMSKDKPTPQDKCKSLEKYQNVYKDSGISSSFTDTICVKCRDVMEGSKKVSDMELFQNDQRLQSNPGSPANEASKSDNSSGSRKVEDSDVILASSGGGNCTSSKETQVTNKRKNRFLHIEHGRPRSTGIKKMKGVANTKRQCTQLNSSISIENGVQQEEGDSKDSDKDNEEDASAGSGSSEENSSSDEDDDSARKILPSGKSSWKSSLSNADDSIKTPNLPSVSAQSSVVENCKIANINVKSPVALIHPLPTPPEASGNLSDEAMTMTPQEENCSVMMALKKMYDGGKLFDQSLTVFRKQPEASITIQFNSSIFRLWRIMCPEGTLRQQKKLWNCTLNIDDAGLKTLNTFVTYLHTGLPPNPAQLVDFLSSSPMTSTDPFVVGLIILQSVFEIGLEDYKTLKSEIVSKCKDNACEEIGLLAHCLEFGLEENSDSEWTHRKEMIMDVFNLMREASSTETTFYLWMRQNQKVVSTLEERHMMFQCLYSAYANSPETPPIRILLANLIPGSPEESDLVFWCKEPDKELYNFKCHSIMLILRQYQEPGIVDFDVMVNKIRGNLTTQIIDKRIMASFMKIVYNVDRAKPAKIDISIKMLVLLSNLFCISNPMELAFGRVVLDFGLNLRMFLDFYDATGEPKYLKDILTMPLMYLKRIPVASLKTKQMEWILQSDDLKMREMDVYKLFICFAKSKPCPDEDEDFKEVPQRVKCLVKFVRFGLMGKKDFEVVEKEKLIPIEIKRTFFYHLTHPDEDIEEAPPSMHKPFVKRNL